MLRTILCWIGIALVGASYLQAASQEPLSSAPPDVSPNRALLNRYCVTCHNEKLRTAELTLDQMDIENISKDAPTWEKVVRKIRARQMPPLGAPRPDEATYKSLLTHLERELDLAAEANFNPGRRAAAHRLNRAEYTNAVRDLLGLEIDSERLLPADDSGGGFDNIADVLAVSPMLLEGYMSAARTISRLAVGNLNISPEVDVYTVSEYLLQDQRMSEDLPFGSKGGVAVRHHFPLDGEYVIKVRLQREESLQVRGIAEPHPMDIRLDGKRIKLVTVGGQNVGASHGMSAQDTVPPDVKQAEYERVADGELEFRFPAQAGARVVAVTFLSEFWAAENLRAAEDAEELGLTSVTISGPYEIAGPGNTPSRRKIFVCTPTSATDEEPCAREILSTLARRAYRRPVNDADMQSLMDLYVEGRREGFEAGIELALRKILISPDFLFRIERDPAGVEPASPYHISDLELASRLSFFLWSSIPDDELLNIAERGDLSDPMVLEQQVQRMLQDPRSRALVENFAGQWLYIRNVNVINPSKDVFPQFDENLREAFRKETELFFESMLREDLSVLDLLRADYTFVNERLARHYGIAGVYGNRFRRVPLESGNRRGLLGQGSILTVTSISNRTSPVVRGKWVLENLLGTPPPEPPANVPALKERGQGGEALTMREQMEQHRASPTCAGCHRLMDPIGFALENFDGIGRWRDADAGDPINTSGVLPDGNEIEGVEELREALLGRPEQIVHTATEKLLLYALGRGIDYYDAPVVRKILREAAPSGYRWSSIILGIVKSAPFQMRRSQ